MDADVHMEELEKVIHDVEDCCVVTRLIAVQFRSNAKVLDMDNRVSREDMFRDIYIFQNITK